MAKKKAKTKNGEQSQVVAAMAAPTHHVEQPQTSIADNENDLLDLSNPDMFRKAFIAAEILNRKY